MSEVSEIIDLTKDSLVMNFLRSDDVIEIDESDSSMIEEIEKKKKRSNEKKELAENLQNTAVGKPDKEIYFGECPICCEQLGKNTLSSTSCGHVFCIKCIEASLKHNPKCPKCRRVLKGAKAYHPLYL